MLVVINSYKRDDWFCIVTLVLVQDLSTQDKSTTSNTHEIDFICQFMFNVDF